MPRRLDPDVPVPEAGPLCRQKYRNGEAVKREHRIKVALGRDLHMLTREQAEALIRRVRAELDRDAAESVVDAIFTGETQAEVREDLEAFGVTSDHVDGVLNAVRARVAD